MRRRGRTFHGEDQPGYGVIEFKEVQGAIYTQRDTSTFRLPATTSVRITPPCWPLSQNQNITEQNRIWYRLISLDKINLQAFSNIISLVTETTDARRPCAAAPGPCWPLLGAQQFASVATPFSDSGHKVIFGCCKDIYWLRSNNGPFVATPDFGLGLICVVRNPKIRPSTTQIRPRPK